MTIISYVLFGVVGALTITAIVLTIIKKIRDKKLKKGGKNDTNNK